MIVFTRQVRLIDAESPDGVVGVRGAVYKLKAGKPAEATYRSAAVSSHLDLPLLASSNSLLDHDNKVGEWQQITT